MILSWTDEAWNDYLTWQSTDEQTLKRINLLIKDVIRSPFDGIGKPEPLKHNLSGLVIPPLLTEVKIRKLQALVIV